MSNSPLKPSYASALGANSRHTHSVEPPTSTTERSNTPSVWTATESWADDDSCFMQAITEADVAAATRQAQQRAGGDSKGWKVVPEKSTSNGASSSVTSSSGSSNRFGASPQPAGNAFSRAPASNGSLGSRFEALAPAGRRGRH